MTFPLVAILNAAGNNRFALYTFRSLTKRLKSIGNSWLIVVKTLMVFHRCIRDGGKLARQGLLQHLHENTGAFDCSNFKDDSNKDAWERGYDVEICYKIDLSKTLFSILFSLLSASLDSDYGHNLFTMFHRAWSRNYAAYLEERLHCLRALGYEKDEACSGESTVMRQLETPALLKNLECLQTLLRKLLNSKPESKPVTESQVIVGAIACVVRESFKIYQITQDGIINLVDKFFEMDYLDAKKAFEIYKTSMKQTEALSQYYTSIKSVPSMSAIDLPTMEKPPESFLVTMEEYLQNAPGRTGSISSPRTRQSSSSTKPRSLSGESESVPPLLEVPLPEKSGSVDSPPDSNSVNGASPFPAELLGLESLVPTSDPRAASSSLSATPVAAPQVAPSVSPIINTPSVVSPPEASFFGSNFDAFASIAPGSVGSSGPVGSSGSIGGTLTNSPGEGVTSSAAAAAAGGAISKNELDSLYDQASCQSAPSGTRMQDASVFSTQPTIKMTYMNQPINQAQQQQWNVQVQQMNMQMQNMNVQQLPQPDSPQSSQPSLL